MTGRVSLREQMPVVSAFIDDLRAAFGAEGINASIRRGMAGQSGAFWAREGGLEVGTPPPQKKRVAAVSEPPRRPKFARGD